VDNSLGRNYVAQWTESHLWWRPQPPSHIVRQALYSHMVCLVQVQVLVLTYSTLQTLGLGAGSSSSPLQGHIGGTPAPFNAFPYGGGHIPPSSPSLSGSHQQSTGQPIYHSLFGVGSQGPPLHNMPVGSTPFSLARNIW
jgi:hypothetical protein